MKSLAYQSSITSKEETGPSADLVDKDSATELGSRGINLTEMTSTFDKQDPTIDEKEPQSNQVLSNKTLNLLINLGDQMDLENEESLANFTNYLIKKFSENKVDSAVLFNKLMIKINNAELVNTNEIIKKLTKIYSRTILLEYLKNQNIEKSKQSAYKKVLHRAEQYLSEE